MGQQEGARRSDVQASVSPGRVQLPVLHGLRHGLAARQGGLVALATLPIVLILWEAGSRSGLLNSLLFPAPSRIWGGFLELIVAPWFPEHLGLTTVETLIGATIGSGAAIVIATVMVGVPLVRALLAPYVVVFQLTPLVVLGPIFITWFGFGIESKIALAAVICFFVVLVNTLVGLESVERNSLLLMSSLAASPRQAFLMLRFPAALPSIFVGLKAAVALALTGAMVGEFLVTQKGIGALLVVFNASQNMTFVFACVAMLWILGLTLFGAVAFFERRIVFWR